MTNDDKNPQRSLYLRINARQYDKLHKAAFRLNQTKKEIIEKLIEDRLDGVE